MTTPDSRLSLSVSIDPAMPPEVAKLLSDGLQDRATTPDKPEALRLADELRLAAPHMTHKHDSVAFLEAAAELLRQHAEIERLSALAGPGGKSLADLEKINDDLVADNERLLAEARAMTWQPIETAPKDGTYVLVWPPTYSGHASCAKWDTDKYAKRPRPYWSRTDADRVTTSRDKPPTHWAPVLAPPAAAAKAVVAPEDIAELRKDAARWRLLRELDWWKDSLCVVRNPKAAVKPGSDCPSGSRLDAAIDAERTAGEVKR